MAHEIANGKQLTDKEFREQQRQQFEAQERIKQRAQALLRRIGEACDELERLAAENPEVVGGATHGEEEHKDAYLRLKARLELAAAAPRCRWVKQDGTACRSPQMKKHIYCFAHRQMMEAHALALSLPAQEDANAIQIGIMRIQKALIEDTISTKKAGLLLYSMQLALQNVGQVTFGQAKTEELVRETVDEEEALRERKSTTETQRHGEKQDSVRMNTGDTDSTDERGGQGLQPLDEHFVPMPGGHGYTRVRLRVEPERKPVQAAIHPGKPNPGFPGTPAIHPGKPNPGLPGTPAIYPDNSAR